MTCNAVVAQLKVSHAVLFTETFIDFEIFKVIIKEEFLPEGILRDLGALVNNVQFSDFVIQVDSKDFNVHKTILSGKLSKALTTFYL